MINLLMISSIALYSFLGFVWHAPVGIDRDPALKSSYTFVFHSLGPVNGLFHPLMDYCIHFARMVAHEISAFDS